MRRNYITPDKVRLLLTKHHYSGIALGKESVAYAYANVESRPLSTDPDLMSTESDWVFISYVNTESAIGSDGMPPWVAADAEAVLDDLFRHNLVLRRAVWFDRLAARQLPNRWPALATLHTLAVPVICVPPTRTIEYSRYQIPPHWAGNTANYFTRIEYLLRQCSHCAQQCPLENDSRLLNLAATLRAWPVTEALLSSSARGAFASFATLDRLQYTLAWYQVLLQLAMRLFTKRNDPGDDAVDLYGPALFQPCQRCIAFSARLSRDEPLAIHIDALEDSLAALVAYAQRLCLPSARQGEGQCLWMLQGALRMAGERGFRYYENTERLTSLATGDFSQIQFDSIASSIVSGRTSLAPCYNPADKWLCALILCNIGTVMTAFQGSLGSFPPACRSIILSLLRSDFPFGRFPPKDTLFLQDGDDESNKCIRCPPCTGRPGSVCFFNEFSGTLPPSSVGSFLSAWGVKSLRLQRLLTMCEDAFFSRLRTTGIAFESYEFELADISDSKKNYCILCRRRLFCSEQYFLPLLLIAWSSTGNPSNGLGNATSYTSSPYTFVTFDVKDRRQVHTWSRGTFFRKESIQCKSCHTLFTQAKIHESEDSLEIHLSAIIPTSRALNIILAALRTSHET